VAVKYSLGTALLWIGGYLLLAAAPLLIAYWGPLPPPRSFWVEFSVGLGFVGLAILGLQFVLTGRFAHVATSLGLDSMLQYHRQAGLVAFFFILAHPLILFLADRAYLEYLDPRANLPRALALSAALGALGLLIVSTLWRQPLRLPYEWWRLLHGLLALFVVLVGLVHILQVGFYVSPGWKQALWVLLTGSALALLINTRIVRPLKMRQKPWRVSEVREERGRAWTLVLQPEGHPGMNFLPGQFVWLVLGKSAFSIQQHPFSLASSATRPDRLELTIKALGDFTARTGDVQPGARAYLEGPYGYFVPNPNPSRGAVFIVGGVGITPVMSMLRTFRDRRDPRPLWLIYANPDWERVLFREELEVLEPTLELKAVHVLENPPEGWTGERGRIGPALLDRHLPDDRGEGFDYFVCGPEPMMDSVVPHLRKRGVPLRSIFSERFQIV
jgi:predicted ferric reductase